jgi:hypothetical protein
VGKPNIKALKRLLTAYGVPKSVKSLSDKRRKRHIPLSHIYYSIFFIVVLNLKSFLQSDQLMREKSVKRFMGSKRKMVVSDTTMIRHLEFNFDTEELKAMNYRVYEQMKGKGYFGHKLTPGSRRRNIAIMDGTGYGEYLVERISIVGEKMLFPLDLEFMEKKGKELPTADVLLEDISIRMPHPAIDLLIEDGLYVSRHHINRCLKKNFHVLIKTDEEGLNILRDANGMFDSESMRKELELYEGFDEKRMVSYEAIAVGDLYLDGVDIPLKVARITERNLKTNEVSRFYAITTDTSLTALEMREGCHLRWEIENNDFRMLNALCASKHDFFKRKDQNEAMEKLLLILFLSFAILNLYNLIVVSAMRQKTREEKRIYDYAKQTRFYLCRLIYNSLMILYSERSVGI